MAFRIACLQDDGGHPATFMLPAVSRVDVAVFAARFSRHKRNSKMYAGNDKGEKN